ncbi:MAG: Mov34/MPN/PAD-1 family protein [Candidatus Heimdallarchaeota archaeon]|nr:Mov34/MPN/PAD-1 family protein [Candidatus Heimdallarchaeota archaeon]MCK4769004.1 Mov34/MPN/PAD-1 family protein [Candidatus Heimdallarchaeota archaeon]
MTQYKKEILISPYVLAKILSVDSIDPTKESAGVLLGYLDEDGETLVVTDFDTGSQKQTSTFVALDDEALVQIVADLQKRDRNVTIVGWAHTHPSFGCFLSGTDKNTQRIYQNLFSHAVALVVDPSKYYNTSQQKDLEIQFFRLIDDLDYKAIPYGIYFDDLTQHLSNLVEVDIKWDIPQLSKEEVRKLHQKLETIVSPKLLENDKKLLHGFVDILSETREELVDVGEGKEILESIDKKLNMISDNVNQIYNEETFNLYAVLNIIAVVMIAISWFLIAFLT